MGLSSNCLNETYQTTNSPSHGPFYFSYFCFSLSLLRSFHAFSLLRTYVVLFLSNARKVSRGGDISHLVWTSVPPSRSGEKVQFNKLFLYFSLNMLQLNNSTPYTALLSTLFSAPLMGEKRTPPYGRFLASFYAKDILLLFIVYRIDKGTNSECRLFVHRKKLIFTSFYSSLIWA